MRKILLFIILFINSCLCSFYICLYYDYKSNNKELSNILDDKEYSLLVSVKNEEKNSYIDKIEEKIGYEFKNIDSFEDIIKELDNNYDKLYVENSNLVNKRDNLIFQKNNLTNVYNEILEEERKKSTFLINNPPKLNQYSLGFPTGCESAALTNLLNYWGVTVSINEVVNTLAKGDLPYYENGIKYGGNPYVEFVGHPSTYYSYGVYEKPIIDVANKYKSGIINGTGMSLEAVLEKVREERPVIVWVSMNMAVPYVSTSWIYKPTGEKISWMANEHALLVVGYNDSQVIVTDSLNGAIRYYNKDVFRSRYNTYGKRALYY